MEMSGLLMTFPLQHKSFALLSNFHFNSKIPTHTEGKSWNLYTLLMPEVPEHFHSKTMCAETIVLVRVLYGQ